MKKAKNSFVQNSVSYYQVKSSAIPEYVRCKRFMPSEWDNNLISVNQLVFVDGDFYDSSCIELPSNELVEVSLEDMSILREEWDRLDKKFTEERWRFVPLFWGTIRIEDLFKNITSEALKNYQSQEFERFGFIFTYAEWDERLLWLCTRSPEVIC
ncbi:hypothetical protein NDI39_06440 [Microcoleus sp. ZQ-A2]|nr:hypothetical protein [Microcoleus sp. FACHB-1]